MKIINDMNLEIAKEIASWNYEGDYAIYNTPSLEVMVEKKYSLVNPAKAKDFFCFYDDEGNLLGYSKVNRKEDCAFLGIGLAPIYTGKGLGKTILSLTIKEIEKVCPNMPILIEVRSWNKRAINCYLSCGFVITETKSQIDHFGNLQEFVFMKYNNN